MSKVFISYRIESPSHAEKVRTLAEQLRHHLDPLGVDLVLDQFLLDEKPGGPTETWPLWCSTQVKESARVLIIASPGWTACFDGKESPEGGAGAVWEAHIIREELYQACCQTDKFRVCFLDPAHAACVPTELAGFHSFSWPKDGEALRAWLGGSVCPPGSVPSTAVPLSSSIAPSSAGVNPGQAKIEFYNRLGDDWEDLANQLQIPGSDQRRIKADRAGREGAGIWEWLENRRQLARLTPACRAIDRSDLAELLPDFPR